MSLWRKRKRRGKRAQWLFRVSRARNHPPPKISMKTRPIQKPLWMNHRMNPHNRKQFFGSYSTQESAQRRPRTTISCVSFFAKNNFQTEDSLSFHVRYCRSCSGSCIISRHRSWRWLGRYFVCFMHLLCYIWLYLQQHFLALAMNFFCSCLIFSICLIIFVISSHLISSFSSRHRYGACPETWHTSNVSHIHRLHPKLKGPAPITPMSR